MSRADKLTGRHGHFGYCRVSTAKQAAEGESLDVQRRQIEGYALMHGLALDDVVIEEGVSGSVPGRRAARRWPAVRQTREGRRGDRPEARSPVPLGPRRSQGGRGIEGAGRALHLLDLGGDIAGNGLSKLFLTIAAAFAEAERDRIRERIGQVKADQKARGRYLGGKVPFGFRRGNDGELVELAAEQEAIREMVALRAQGKALRAIAEAAQAKGHRISHEGVAGVLRVARMRQLSTSGRRSPLRLFGRDKPR